MISSSGTSRRRSKPDHHLVCLDRDRLDRFGHRPAEHAERVEEDPEQHRRKALPPDRELADVQPEVTTLASPCARLEADTRAHSEPHRALEPRRWQDAGEPGERRLGGELSERESAPEVHGFVTRESQPDGGERYVRGLHEVAREKRVQLTLGEHGGFGGAAVAWLSAGDRVDLPLRPGTVPWVGRR
jgi:hypothetical protein